MRGQKYASWQLVPSWFNAVLFKDISRSPVSRLAHWQMNFCFPLAVAFSKH